MMLEWLRRVLHLGPDYERVADDTRLARETFQNLARLDQADAGLHTELHIQREQSAVARALLRARDGGVQRRRDEEWSRP